ncbi:MAG TPA: Crp/Fnr family transcriptional regulator [Thermaerobacter sp.]
MPEGPPDSAFPATWIPEGDIRWALDQALPRSFPTGSTIYTPARPPAGMYLLRSGIVRIGVDDLHGGTEHFLTLACENWWIGDPGPLFGQHPIRLTATCVTPCETAYWPYARLESMLRDRPALAAALVYHGAASFRLAVRRMEVLMQPCSRLRVLDALRLLLQVYGQGDATAGSRIRFPLTQGALGAIANVSRVTVNRVLSELRRQGIVATGSRTVVVRRPDRLEALFQAEVASLSTRGRTLP